jgi:hypothetical protein
MSADAHGCAHCGRETKVRPDPVFDFACTACGGPRLEHPVQDTRTRGAVDRTLVLAKAAAEQPSWAARVALVAVAASNLLLLVAILQGAQPTVLGGFVTVVSWANVFFLIRGRHARQAARARPHLDAARLLSGQTGTAPARVASGIAALPTRIAADAAKTEEPEVDERSLLQTDLDDFDARLREAERRKAAK